MAVDVTVTQGFESVDGTASWSAWSGYDACSGGSGSFGGCTATGGYSPSPASQTCDATFATTAPGSKTFTYNTNSGSQSRTRTCELDTEPQGSGAAGTCVDLGGTTRAIDYVETQDSPCTQDSYPAGCTAHGSDTGTMAANGTAAYGTPYLVGSPTMQVASYTYGAWSAWDPPADTVAAGTTFTQTRTRTVMESLTASTQEQQKDCDSTLDPVCGGALGTCSGGETAGTTGIADGTVVITPASGPTTIDGTVMNGGIEMQQETGTMASDAIVISGITGPNPGFAGETQDYNVTFSTNEGPSIIQYSWQVDGDASQSAGTVNTGATFSVDVTSSPGFFAQYIVRVTVTKGTASDNANITVMVVT